MRSMLRYKEATTQTVTFRPVADIATTGGFNLGVFSGAMLLMTSTPSAGDVVLTFYAKDKAEDSTNFAVHNTSNTAVTMTVRQGRAYPLPDELFAAGYVLATTASGTATAIILTKT